VLLVRLSIWLAIAGYAGGAVALLQSRRGGALPSWGRWSWTIGCACFLAHVFCAFAFVHAWSHAAAYAETARQTAQLTRLRWGGGLYLNYLVGVAWLADVFWWWHSPLGYSRRPVWLSASWHGFLFFMIFNGAVVFGHGAVRWYGLTITILLALAWSRTRPR
jgi:hypothetical protein